MIAGLLLVLVFTSQCNGKSLQHGTATATRMNNDSAVTHRPTVKQQQSEPSDRQHHYQNHQQQQHRRLVNSEPRLDTVVATVGSIVSTHMADSGYQAKQSKQQQQQQLALLAAIDDKYRSVQAAGVQHNDLNHHHQQQLQPIGVLDDSNRPPKRSTLLALLRDIQHSLAANNLTLNFLTEPASHPANEHYCTNTTTTTTAAASPIRANNSEQQQPDTTTSEKHTVTASFDSTQETTIYPTTTTAAATTTYPSNDPTMRSTNENSEQELTEEKNKIEEYKAEFQDSDNNSIHHKLNEIKLQIDGKIASETEKNMHDDDIEGTTNLIQAEESDPVDISGQITEAKDQLESRKSVNKDDNEDVEAVTTTESSSIQESETGKQTVAPSASVATTEQELWEEGSGHETNDYVDNRSESGHKETHGVEYTENQTPPPPTTPTQSTSTVIIYRDETTALYTEEKDLVEEQQLQTYTKQQLKSTYHTTPSTDLINNDHHDKKEAEFADKQNQTAQVNQLEQVAIHYSATTEEIASNKPVTDQQAQPLNVSETVHSDRYEPSGNQEYQSDLSSEHSAKESAIPAPPRTQYKLQKRTDSVDTDSGLEAYLIARGRPTQIFVANLNRIALTLHADSARRRPRQNMVLSPLAVASSLGMLYLGARGNTADQIDSILAIDQMNTFNPHVGFFKFQRYVNQLPPHGTAAMCNILLKDSHKSEMFDGYKTILERFYKPAILEVDMSRTGEMVKQTAEKCIASSSNGAAKLHVHNVSALFDGSLVAASATFFNLSVSPSLIVQPVEMQFLRFPSALRRVLLTPGVEVRGRLDIGYSRQQRVTVAALPVASQQLLLVLLLPGDADRFSADGLAQLEARLSPAVWHDIIKSTLPRQATVRLPLVSHRTTLDLRPFISRHTTAVMAAEGDPAPAAVDADFSGINGIRDLQLSGFMHISQIHVGSTDLLHLHAGSHAGSHGDHHGHDKHGDHHGHDKHGDHHGHDEHGDHHGHDEHGDHHGHDKHGDHHGHDDHGDHHGHDDHGDHHENGNHQIHRRENQGYACNEQDSEENGLHGIHAQQPVDLTSTNNKHSRQGDDDSRQETKKTTQPSDFGVHDNGNGRRNNGPLNQNKRSSNQHSRSHDSTRTVTNNEEQLVNEMKTQTKSRNVRQARMLNSGTSEYLTERWQYSEELLPWERIEHTNIEQMPSPQQRTEPWDISFERAFLYALVHKSTGAIIMSGRYMDPDDFA